MVTWPNKAVATWSVDHTELCLYGHLTKHVNERAALQLGGGRVQQVRMYAGRGDDYYDEVGRCRLTVSKPELKPPMVSALDTII
jgi:hypothetical protein